MVVLLLGSLAFCRLPSIADGERLPRQADLGASLRHPGGGQTGAIVTQVSEGSVLGGVDVGNGDRILRIDGVALEDDTSMQAALQALHGGALASFSILRDGDSEGPPCAATDFAEEFAAYRAAFERFRGLDFVDPQRIVILGLSKGGGIAPLVAGDHPVAGFVVSGAWVKTWLEHMLELERRRLAPAGDEPAEVNRRLGVVGEASAPVERSGSSSPRLQR